MNLEEQVMLDLETFGNGSNAMIVAIGACDFELNHKFYTVIDPTKSTGDIDASTVVWWLSQNEAARSALTVAREALHPALAKLAAWLQNRGRDVCVWGNGATFDNVILANAYKRHDMPVPWKFWNDRCFRTLKAMHPQVQPPVREGTHHNALDDAVFQVQYARKILGVSNE